MIGARKRERTCQEANMFGIMKPGTGGLEPMECGQAATLIVDNGDRHPYWMCPMCADHNVKNRGAIAWVPQVYSQEHRETLDKILELAVRYGQIDGAHHKMWVIDQVVRLAAGKDYDEAVADPDRDWDTGIAP